MKSIIYDVDYTPHFSGHETFPLRQMWLKKAFDAVLNSQKGAFSNEDAIVTFGVGKNMVSSIKHWAIACGIIESKSGSYSPTELGERIFSADGLDPYCEEYATSWIAHWNLAGRTNKNIRATTWFLIFNHVSEQRFSTKQLQQAIHEYLESKSPKIKVSTNTITRDVEVFLRTYATKPSASVEDVAEPMLAELELVRVGLNGLYEFHRGSKSTLPDNVFLYALVDFWSNYLPGQSALSFEAIAYAPGSPGRVFKLDEDSVADRLIGLEQLTKGKYIWSDTAGQKNVYCLDEMSLIQALEVQL